ncbi:uncharacterized protein si:ch211-227n13.3 isoform X2 [Callorhinchus milii]|nr:uncharacterized protein si:ch211-227n13.3 isoform X2 [Callorhinchus milii]
MESGGGRRAAAGRRQRDSLGPREVERKFQEVYNSLLGTKYGIRKMSPTNSLCAQLPKPGDSYSFKKGLQNTFCENSAIEDVLKCKLSKDMPISDLSRSNILKHQTGEATNSWINSIPAPSLNVKQVGMKCNEFPGGVKSSMNSNTGFHSSPVMDPDLQILSFSSANNDWNEGGSSELSCDNDDVLSIDSGEAVRETVTCKACSKLLLKMINQKKTMSKKNKLTLKKKKPYEPALLSCDQWVLKKPSLPRNELPPYRRKIHSLVKYLHKRAQSQVVVKKRIQCCRPHVFLQRNLRHCKRKVKKFLRNPRKKNGKKKLKRNKKELFIFKLSENRSSSIVISDSEDSEAEPQISTLKRKLISAVMYGENRAKMRLMASSDEEDFYGFSEKFNSSERCLKILRSRLTQCKSGSSSSVDTPTFDLCRPSKFGEEKTSPIYSTSSSESGENKLSHHYENELESREVNTVQPSSSSSSSFGWLNPG